MTQMMLTLIVFNNTIYAKKNPTTIYVNIHNSVNIPLGIPARYVLRTHKPENSPRNLVFDLLVKQFTNYNFEAVLGNMSHDPRGDYLDIGLGHKTSIATVNQA